MVKGVNRNIIEIAETNSEVFERAILFVRPDSPQRAASALETQAKRYLGGLRPRRPRQVRQRLFIALRYLSAAGLGSLLTWLLLQL